MTTKEKALGYLLAGRYEVAEKIYKKLSMKEPSEDSFYHLGVCYYNTNRYALAKDALISALKAKPTSARANSVLGMCLYGLDERDAALRHHRNACDLEPYDYIYWGNLGQCLRHAGKYEDSIVAFTRALSLNPNFLDARCNKALSKLALGLQDQALDELRNLHAEFPDRWFISTNLIALLVEHDLTEEAEVVLTRSLSTRCKELNLADSVKDFIKIGSSLINVPLIYEDDESRIRCREHLEWTLDELTRVIKTVATDEIEKAETIFLALFFRLSNFSWAYQGLDDSGINSKYAHLIRACLPRYTRAELKSSARNNIQKKSIKIGVCSAYFGLHATRWIGDILKQVKDSIDIDLSFIALNSVSDKAYFDSLSPWSSTQTILAGEETFERVLKKILAERFDFVIYPDIGMTPISRILSCFRLGRVQLCHWAHPVTTGSPVIDWFVSGSKMEPENSGVHYSEKLLCLPDLGLYLPGFDHIRDESRVGTVDRNDSKFRIATIQSLFKYSPQYDWIYVQLCKYLPTTVIEFIEHPSHLITSKFANRLEKVFAAAGLKMSDYIIFHRRMNRSELLQFLSGVDLYLDTFGWSGGNTALDALEAACPVVTVPGEFMRGRHTYGVFKTMNVLDGVCLDFDQMLNKVRAFHASPELLASYKKKIIQKRRLLAHKQEVIVAFAEWLSQVSNKKPV